MAAPAKKQFVRTHVPAQERFWSFVLLTLLAAIGVAVAIKGRHYDPSRFNPDSSALASTQAAMAGDDPSLLAGGAAVSAMGTSGVQPAAGQTANVALAPAAGGAELTLDLPNLSPQGPTEQFGPDDLYKKIDGQAEGYLGFDFQHMRCRTFDVTGGGGSYVDLFEYDMGKPVNAYGIYAVERDAAAPMVDFASDGYRSQMGFFLRQGKFYLQIIASDQKQATLAAAEAIARALAKAIPPDDSGLEGLKRLPAGFDPASVSFTLADAFGIPGLGNAYSADYAVDGVTQKFFISAQSDAAAAAKVYAAFESFAKQFGTATDLDPIGEAKRFEAESFGQWKSVYLRGAEIGGIVDSDHREAAGKFVKDYLDGTLKLPPFKAAPGAAPAAPKTDAMPAEPVEGAN